MAKATMTSKGQVTIPKSIRDYLGAETGDRLSFEIRETGEVVVQAETADVRELRGALPRPARKVSLDEMEAAVRRGAARRK